MPTEIIFNNLDLRVEQERARGGGHLALRRHGWRHLLGFGLSHGRRQVEDTGREGKEGVTAKRSLRRGQFLRNQAVRILITAKLVNQSWALRYFLIFSIRKTDFLALFIKLT